MNEINQLQTSSLGLRQRYTLVNCLCISIWLLTVITFTRPGRIETQGTIGIDWLALSKLVSKCIAAACLFFALARFGSRSRMSQCRSLFFPLGLFACWGICSASWSALGSVTVAQAGCFAVLILLAYAIAASMTNELELCQLMKHVSFSLTTVSIVLLLAKCLFPHIGNVERGLAGQGTAGLLHPTVASSTAALGVLVQLMGDRVWSWNWARRHSIWILPSHFIVLALANTRWANVLVIALSALIFVQTMRVSRVSKSLTALGVLVIGYLSFDPALTYARWLTDPIVMFAQRGQSLSQISSFSGRSEIWRAMWQSFVEAPLCGHGFYVTSAEGSLRVWHARGNFTAHNVWLQALVTTGIVGFLLLCLGLLTPFFELVRHRSIGTVEVKLKFTLLVLVAWFMGWSLLNVSFLAPFQPEAVVFFVVVGLCGSLWQGLQIEQEYAV